MKDIYELLERAAMLVGNPGTNISGGTDTACDQWQKDYAEYKLQPTPAQREEVVDWDKYNELLNIVIDLAIKNRSTPDDRNLKNRFLSATSDLRNFITRNPQPSSGGWVDAKERLPDHCNDVLCFDGLIMLVANRYKMNRKNFVQFKTHPDGDYESTVDVSHWHPLPPPPNQSK